MAQWTQTTEDIRRFNDNFFAVAEAMKKGLNNIRVHLIDGKIIEGFVCGSHMENDGARQGIRHGRGDITIQTSTNQITIDCLDIDFVEGLK